MLAVPAAFLLAVVVTLPLRSGADSAVPGTVFLGGILGLTLAFSWNTGRNRSVLGRGVAVMLFELVAAIIMALAVPGTPNARDAGLPPPTAVAESSTAVQVSTKSASSTPLPDRSQARVVDPRELVARPEAFVGQNVILQGMTLTVRHYDEERRGILVWPSRTWLQLLAEVGEGKSPESVAVEFYPAEPALISQECYRIYGIVEGTSQSIIVITGVSRAVPSVRGYSWERVPEGNDGFRCPPPTISVR